MLDPCLSQRKVPLVGLKPVTFRLWAQLQPPTRWKAIRWCGWSHLAHGPGWVQGAPSYAPPPTNTSLSPENWLWLIGGRGKPVGHLKCLQGKPLHPPPLESELAKPTRAAWVPAEMVTRKTCLGVAPRAGPVRWQLCHSAVSPSTLFSFSPNFSILTL